MDLFEASSGATSGRGHHGKARRQWLLLRAVETFEAAMSMTMNTSDERLFP